MTLDQDSAQNELYIQHVSTWCTGIGGVQPHSVRTDCPFCTNEVATFIAIGL